MAAPAESRTPNMHRAKQIAPRECGWKHGDSGHSAGQQTLFHEMKKIDLTPTGLLMEGVYTHLTYGKLGGGFCDSDPRFLHRDNHYHQPWKNQLQPQLISSPVRAKANWKRMV
jgi:hypothetical protein